jgi:hypothetical protein
MIVATILAVICIQDLRWWFSYKKIRKEHIQVMKELREGFQANSCCDRKVCKKRMARLQLEKEQAVKDSRTCIICRNEEKTCVVTACWHLFCVNCCWRMHMNGNKCAVCRSEMCGWTPIYWTD